MRLDSADMFPPAISLLDTLLDLTGVWLAAIGLTSAAWCGVALVWLAWRLLP